MKSAVAAAVTVTAWLILFNGLVSAFIVWKDPPALRCNDTKCICKARTTLFAKRRGKLGLLIEEGVVAMGDIRTKKAPKVGRGGIASQQVSPDLASYMLGKQQPESSPSAASLIDAAGGDESSASGPAADTSKTKGSSLSRRARSTERMLIGEENSKEVEEIVKQLQQAISKRKDVGSAIDQSLQRLPINVTKLKQLVKSATPLDYRLAWIASDAAVCAVGSALHRKIALARLQEVYLTLHRNRLQLLEVVRILGPFPNVKNTLSGAAKFARLEGENQMTITWQSLIDGTGKEKFEGGETKVATLDVLYGDEQLIVARLLDNDIPRGGDSVVFIRDNDMDTTLESLRVL